MYGPFWIIYLVYDILIILHIFSSQAIALPRLVTRERRSPTPQSDTTEEEETQLDEARYYLRKTSARGFGGKGLEPRLSCESAGEGLLSVQTYAIVHK